MRDRTTFRPGLEVLEDRLAPAVSSTWVGPMTEAQNWNLAANWDNGVPLTAADSAHFPNNFNAQVTCPTTSLLELDLDNGGSGKITLTAGGLALDTLKMHGDIILFANSGDSLTVFNSATFDHGAIGDDSGNGDANNFVINNGGALLMAPQIGVQTGPWELYAKTYVGTTPDLQTASAGTLTMRGLSLNMG